jgi:hypothetical protein
MPDHLLDEMIGMKRVLSGVLTQKLGPVWVFEHGPATERRLAGCGIDHAHLHIVPLEFDLAEAAGPFLPRGSAFRSGSMADCKRYARLGYDYLYAERPSGEGLFAVHRGLGSQIFRKAVASADGNPDEYNWQDNPRLENVVATIATLTSFRSIPGLDQDEPRLVNV